MRRPNPPSNADPTPVLLVLTPHLLDVLIGSSVAYQRQRRVDGLTFDAELSDLVIALAGARPGPAVTSLDGPLRPVHADDNRLLLTYREAAARLAISERHVKRLIKGGHLHRVHLGSAARVHVDDLTAYTSKLREEAT